MGVKYFDCRKVAKIFYDMNERDILNWGLIPKIAVLQVGDNDGDNAYNRAIKKKCDVSGIEFEHCQMKEDASEADISIQLGKYNSDSTVDGILLQMHRSRYHGNNCIRRIANRINPIKDVDGLSDDSIAKLWTGIMCFKPCTAEAVIAALNENNVPLDGENAVIINRSDIIGKPLAKMLLDKNATVTVCHSHTTENTLWTSFDNARVVVTGIGKAHYLGTYDISMRNNTDTMHIVDCGISKNENGICGDVEDDGSLKKVILYQHLGALTTAILLRHTVEARHNYLR